MAEPFESPVDVEALVPTAALPGVAQMAVAIGIAAFLTLALNTHALAAWTAAWPPDPRVAALDAAAQDLAKRAAARELDGVRAAVRLRWAQAKAADWPAQR
jgi:hypothetical protein